MRISDWSSDVCSSDLAALCSLSCVVDGLWIRSPTPVPKGLPVTFSRFALTGMIAMALAGCSQRGEIDPTGGIVAVRSACPVAAIPAQRSEEHTSELQSLMRISYAVFCLKKKKNKEYHIELCTETDSNDIR